MVKIIRMRFIYKTYKKFDGKKFVLYKVVGTKIFAKNEKKRLKKSFKFVRIYKSKKTRSYAIYIRRKK